MMFKAEWNAAYETGHPRIDFEHRIFLDLILEIEREISRDAPIERIRRRVIEVMKYADFHFFSEESIMIEVGYPDLEAHVRMHRALLEDLNRYVLSFSIDLVRDSDLVRFLVDWFSCHTIREDLKIARFIAAARQ